MKITHLGHSCVLVETGTMRAVIDPGNFSDTWHDLTGLDAVVITHWHPDHADPGWLPELVARNPSARVLAEPGVPANLTLERLESFRAGSAARIGKATITAVGGVHARIHQDIPRIGNIGVVIAEDGGPAFFHPGDALDTVPEGIDVLAIPAQAPWCAIEDTVDFARAVAAPRGFLIHEGLINERGWALTFNRLNEMTATRFADLRDAGPTEFLPL